ncbi:unnamed protein product [Cuscuta campestris]|uniref:Mechanosensitive ion channel MscS domain-containing protein n=1 Tax=Cuscuta campestris TaxID=132261 RepID=A0A484N1X4_9ASTE|nr:unnamed protein product [Cuscuta campestris]
MALLSSSFFCFVYPSRAVSLFSSSGPLWSGRLYSTSVGGTGGSDMGEWGLKAKEALQSLGNGVSSTVALCSEWPAGLLSDRSILKPVPYEKSIWGALEDPVRYLITFMAFTQIGAMVAPTSVASHFILPAWRSATILSSVWFLQRWKTNAISRTLAGKTFEAGDRDRLLTLEKVSSVGLFAIGLMGLAEACGVPVQSILTVGGIGGVAIAIAARDVIGNVLSGLSLQFSRPFSVGEMIRAGYVEGQVVEMGMTTTSLLTEEMLPVTVPNSLFTSQVP